MVPNNVEPPTEFLNVDLSAEGWRMQIGESQRFPGTETSEDHIYSPRGTAFAKRSGGGGRVGCLYIEKMISRSSSDVQR
jgi:hypothetical protein